MTSGRSLEERALEGTGWYRNNDGILDSRVNRDVEGAILRSELPKYYCWFNHFSGCPRSFKVVKKKEPAQKNTQGISSCHGYCEAGDVTVLVEKIQDWIETSGTQENILRRSQN